MMKFKKLKCRTKKDEKLRLKSIQSFRKKSYTTKPVLENAKSNTNPKCWTRLVDVNAIKCYSIAFYIVVCLLGNVVTGIFLCCHNNEPDKFSNTVDVIKTIKEDTKKEIDEVFGNATNLVDDWIAAMEKDAETLLEPLVKDDVSKVSIYMKRYGIDLFHIFHIRYTASVICIIFYF